jgi:hypothetical protein
MSEIASVVEFGRAGWLVDPILTALEIEEKKALQAWQFLMKAHRDDPTVDGAIAVMSAYLRLREAEQAAWDRKADVLMAKLQKDVSAPLGEDDFLEFSRQLKGLAESRGLKVTK